MIISTVGFGKAPNIQSKLGLMMMSERRTEQWVRLIRPVEITYSESEASALLSLATSQ